MPVCSLVDFPWHSINGKNINLTNNKNTLRTFSEIKDYIIKTKATCSKVKQWSWNYLLIYYNDFEQYFPSCNERLGRSKMTVTFNSINRGWQNENTPNLPSKILLALRKPISYKKVDKNTNGSKLVTYFQILLRIKGLYKDKWTQKVKA